MKDQKAVDVHSIQQLLMQNNVAAQEGEGAQRKAHGQDAVQLAMLASGEIVQDQKGQ